MSEQISKPFEAPAATKTAAKTTDEDLSAEIARTVVKKTRELVTCRRISQNHYRCNWWTPEGTGGYDNPLMQGLMVTTNRISNSSFLHVTRSAEGLAITVISSDKPPKVKEKE